MHRTDDLLGRCQNMFWTNGPGGQMTDVRYCDNPAMNIGGARNSCAACGAARPVIHEQLMRRTVEAFDVAGAARWLAGSKARYLDQCGWAYTVAAGGRTLPDVWHAQGSADRTGDIANAMLARWRDHILHAIRLQQLDPDDSGLTGADLEPYGLPRYGLSLAA